MSYERVIQHPAPPGCKHERDGECMAVDLDGYRVCSGCAPGNQQDKAITEVSSKEYRDMRRAWRQKYSSSRKVYHAY